ncbi:unnamed protein product [Meganyctiphanes norvegica]|uniref:Sialin n=1 Tax=Meganyctiphanes norvegica TaxID=48144 RepID=A0AAV2PYR9_MEGNR
MMDWIPARWALAFMCCLGTMNIYMVRINLNIAVVAMVKSNRTPQDIQAECLVNDTDTKSINSSRLLQLPDNSTQAQEGEFEWDEAMQGVLIGSFFYGYLVTQVMGGRLSEMYGSKWIVGLCVMSGGLFALITPMAARTHYGALVAVRVLQGLCQGVCFPSMMALLPRWAVPNERARFMTINFVGIPLGVLVGMPLCGWVIDEYGWPSAFYVTGILSLVWCFMWFPLMYDDPKHHPRISDAELEYIQKGCQDGGSGGAPKSVPWLAIIRSPPFWALLIVFLGNEYGFTLYVTALPTYMKNILGFSMKQNGLISALPMLVGLTTSLIVSFLSDWLLSNNYLSLYTTRKLFQGLRSFGMAASLGVVGFSGCHPLLAVGLLCLGQIFQGLKSAGPNRSEFAPNFTGTIWGITNGAATVVSFLVPLINGLITNGEQTLYAWRKVFLINVPVYLVSVIIFLIFYTTDIQPWNFKSTEEKDKNKENTKL